jgi:glycosyltransferase involved in cell wall biosynthesis
MTTVSIIICTRNRAQSLGHTLRSIAGCTVPGDVTAELLVIDNGSTDTTRDVVRRTDAGKLSLRYVFEPKAGLCNARNRALSECAGSVMLFTDDDIHPPVDWIEGMCRPIFSGEADAVAGAVHFPADYAGFFEHDPLRSRRGWFASTEGIDPEHPYRMVGANMAIRRSVAAYLGGFDTELGAGALGFGEETLFSRRLIDEGFRLAGAFDVSVEHIFDRNRATPQQMLAVAERMGRSEGYLAHHWHQYVGPELKDVIRARAGLVIRRLLHPGSWWNRSAREWEVSRTERVALLEMRYTLRHQPPKYRRTARKDADLVPVHA